MQVSTQIIQVFRHVFVEIVFFCLYTLMIPVGIFVKHERLAFYQASSYLSRVEQESVFVADI